ncbi:probable transmembrane ascorbate ferrireductase 3 [Carica papaya]|uniref:probable transmembrane ascorbate ferrireductase 3 n=1 Tax=Carica papaya TaxID=3649 RepID=UPI000B8C8E03|nr:probable transmembrane ascorbate ferrireductase 3 [Carica papaya]
MDMDGSIETRRHLPRYRNASRLTIVAHLFGSLAFFLMLVWLLHFREGIEYDSDNPARVFNTHPFLMFCGFIYLVGQAMMVYKTLIMWDHKVQKIAHMVLHLMALCLGIAGICAAFKFHDMRGIQDLTSLHSWIGLITFCLFGLQWLFGLWTFMVGRMEARRRAIMLPWHVCGGKGLFMMGICAALTGLMERQTILAGGTSSQSEFRLINFLGLSILIFAIFVDLTVSLARYV